MSAIPLPEQKIILIRSGGICAFPGCKKLLVKKAAFGTRNIVVGEMAHIVSEKPEGPRGKHYLPPGEHDKHPNLMLMCLDHHTEIDTAEDKYPVELLRQMKKDHEDAIEKGVVRAKEKNHIEVTDLALLTEPVYSTLLPVTRMPQFVFSAPCNYGDSQEREAARAVLLDETSYLCPFIIRNGNILFAFNDLRQQNGPFRNIIDVNKVRISKSSSWLNNPDRERWLKTMLSRTLNKLTGHKKLQLDKLHHRYFFNPDEPGKEKSVDYRPLNKSATTRRVVWQPVRKKTNEPRPFWNHLAVNLRFLDVGKEQWCLCIRPELRVTKDGKEPIEPENVGRHVTRHTSHQFNYDLLEDVNFWRDFLSDGQPRIVLRFGQRSGIVISTTLMSADIQWPGIPEEHAKPFTNVEYDEDLFTSSEFSQFQAEDEQFVKEADLDDGEDDLDE